MLNNRLKAAEAVASELNTLESAIDAAISRAASLVEALPNARIEGRLAATVGQDAFISASKTLNRLVRARSDVVALHNVLSGVKEDIGLRTYAIGAGWKIAPAAQVETNLRVVAT